LPPSASVEGAGGGCAKSREGDRRVEQPDRRRRPNETVRHVRAVPPSPVEASYGTNQGETPPPRSGLRIALDACKSPRAVRRPRSSSVRPVSRGCSRGARIVGSRTDVTAQLVAMERQRKTGGRERFSYLGSSRCGRSPVLGRRAARVNGTPMIRAFSRVRLFLLPLF